MLSRAFLKYPFSCVCITVYCYSDVMMWTSEHVMEWVEMLHLDCHAPNLKERGVHGGVLALDYDYGADKLAMALQIPLADVEVNYITIHEVCILFADNQFFLHFD